MRLWTRVAPLWEAAYWIDAWHRHLKKPPIQVVTAFAVCSGEIGALWGERVHGVATLEVPRSRVLMKRGDLEVTRCATDGTRNACSALYGACRRWVRRHRKGHGLITYTLESESGVSLRAAGWECEGRASKGGKSWSRGSKSARLAKLRWRGLVSTLAGAA